MREIKFKVWDRSRKVMLSDVRLSGMLNKKFQCDNIEYLQFTGLKDKNDVELYDRDIIQSLHFVDHLGVENYLRFVVQWSERLKGWVAIRSDGTEMQIWVYADSVRGEFEVIGNTYENPELLESK